MTLFSSVLDVGENAGAYACAGVCVCLCVCVKFSGLVWFKQIGDGGDRMELRAGFEHLYLRTHQRKNSASC